MFNYFFGCKPLFYNLCRYTTYDAIWWTALCNYCPSSNSRTSPNCHTFENGHIATNSNIAFNNNILIIFWTFMMLVAKKIADFRKVVVSCYYCKSRADNYLFLEDYLRTSTIN